MIARVVTRSGLSDVSDTSVVKHILAAAARADDELYYQMTLLLQLFSIDTATGSDLDERAKDIQPAVISRRQAVKSAGSVVFSRTGATGALSIPIGTKVKTAGGIVFSTTSAGAISSTSPEQIPSHGVGRDSNLVSVVADVAGANGNVAANTVIKFIQKPAGVDEVTNPSAFSLGLDKESDDAFRNRIKQFIASLARCTVDAIETGVLGAQDPDTGATILFAKIVEDIVERGNVELFVDDGTGSAESVAVVAGENVTLGLNGPPPDSAVGGETQLSLNNKPIKDIDPFTLTSSVRGALVRDPGTGVGDYTLNPADGQIIFDPALVTGEVIQADYTHFTGLIALAQKIVDGDPGDRERYPGLRAAGVQVVVKVPQILLQNVDVTVTVREGFDQNETQSGVRQAIKDYINNLRISDDVIRFELARRIMAAAGVFNIVLTTPTDDVVMLDDQLARTTDANILVN